ncbi:DUF1014-domain-containing protein [Thozetella sp. PMI_491]|nr:DUF1014-domain-containing protein [Thozetella sp. PMI_491]
MGKTSGAFENSRKAAGNARKAEVAAQKAAAEDAKKEADEAEKWSKGSKSNSKKEAEASKKAELARKKAERDAQMADEESSMPARAKAKNTKTAPKKTKGLDLSQLDDAPLSSLNASGIDNALDALSVTEGGSSDSKIDRHPERRFKAAYAKFEDRRLKEMEDDGTGAHLRLAQRKDKIRKEFEKSPENPFNQLSAQYNASKDHISEMRAQEKAKIETRLAGKD